MSHPRKEFLELFERAKGKTPQKVTEAFAAAKVHWEDKSLLLAAKASRAFDPFEHLDLGPQKIIQASIKTFLALPPIAPKHIVDMQIIHKEDQKHMTLWTKTLVRHACAVLLDNDGSIHSDILKCLQVKNVSAFYLRSCVPKIVCSYILGQLIANIFIGIQTKRKEKKDFPEAVNEFFNNLFSKGKQKKTSKELTDIDIARLGYVHLMTSKLVKAEIEVNYKSEHYTHIEADANTFFEKIDMRPELKLLLDKEQDLKKKKVNSTKRLAFWLEVMMLLTQNDLLFLTIWKDILKFNTSHTLPLLDNYQRNQFDFCRRRFSELYSLKSTKELLQTFSAEASESKAIIPVSESKAVSIPAPLQLSAAETKSVVEEVKKPVTQDEKEEDYEWISNYGPAINYEVSALSLFKEKVIHVLELTGVVRYQLT